MNRSSIDPPALSDSLSGEDRLQRIRHSAAHLMAEAIQSLFPEARFAIGPPIEDGFYYDVELPRSLTPDDLGHIEERMRELQEDDAPFLREVVSRARALELFADNPYKIEIIEQLPDEETITTYRQGDFLDLCRGPHVASTADIGPYTLMNVSGAYWRGDEHRPMLQRIYGTAWETREQLDAYLKRQEQARLRDHRRLGRELELFFLHPTAPGMPYWLPNGVILLDRLVGYWREVHADAGYHEIATPMLNRKELFETSGHWQHFHDEMFTLDLDDSQIYGLKPMNCPNAMITFAHARRSYRDLPLRLADLSPLHRYERSGTLNGLFRVRGFRQDDAHIFVAPAQLGDEFGRVLELVDRFYTLFGLEYRFRLGTRPDEFLGDIETWNQAEAILESVLRDSERDFWIEHGDGAFYGPKIDILMRDSLGREWQMGTLQLDFQMPRQFELRYQAEDGSLQTPITIHRAIYGSVERFVGILIEHLNGAFPAWLAPEQVRIIPITDGQVGYAREVADQLRREGLRAMVDDSSERMQAKIRESQVRKVPYMLVVGRREAEAGTVSVRLRTGEDLGAMPVDSFLDLAKAVIASRSLDVKYSPGER
jgi:threonyl-tRNA synthetase